jgi:small subunit ribosomal protein S3
VGQKVNPRGFRVGVYKQWDSRWFARSQSYAKMFLEDLRIREFICQQLPGAEISHIEIEKAGDENVRIVIHSARVGIVIGKRGQDIDTLRKNLSRHLNKKSVEISVQEVRQPELDATLVAQSIAEQIERRTNYKRAMKKETSNAMRSGALGINIAASGRLADADIARREMVRVGVVPRHTLRADIDYGTALAKTTFGIIGIKVWIYRGPYNIAERSVKQP